MSEDLKAIVRRGVESWNTGDITIMDEIIAKDFVNHYPFDPNVCDLESYKQFITACRTGMPDIHVTIDDMIAEGG